MALEAALRLRYLLDTPQHAAAAALSFASWVAQGRPRRTQPTKPCATARRYPLADNAQKASAHLHEHKATVCEVLRYGRTAAEAVLPTYFRSGIGTTGCLSLAHVNSDTCLLRALRGKNINPNTEKV